MALKLKLIPGLFAVCRLEPEADVPGWATTGPLSSITRTAEELSIICLEAQVPAGVLSENGWRCLKVQGPLPFELTGVIASLVSPLAQAGISLLAFSTYETDYVLVKDETLAHALNVLTHSGHTVE